MSSKLSVKDYAEFLRLLSQATSRLGEFAKAIENIFAWLAAKSSSPAETYKSLGLGSGAIVYMEHYERVMDVLRELKDKDPPLDDVLRP